jgi:hypothetical protein
MSWDSTKLRDALEHGDFAVAADHYAPDAIIDLTVPAWRFQVEGRQTIMYKLAEDFGSGITFTRWTQRDAPWGAVVEVEAMQGETFFRWVDLYEIAEGQIVRQSQYCSGEWSPAQVERWRREAPMIDAT